MGAIYCAFGILAITTSFVNETVKKQKPTPYSSLEKGVTGTLYKINKIEDLKDLNATEVQFKNAATGHYIVLKNDPRGGGVLECSEAMQMKPWYLYQTTDTEFNNTEIKTTILER